MKRYLLSIIIIYFAFLGYGFKVGAAAIPVIKEKPAFDSIKVDSSGTAEISFKEDYSNTYNNYSDYYDEEDDEDYYSYYDPEGYELYRSEQEDGEYNLVASGTLASASNKCTDSSADIGKVYYYKMRYSNNDDEIAVYSEYSAPIKVSIVPAPAAIKNVRATAAKTFTIKWGKTSNIDGYNIYMKEFDNDNLSYMHQYSTWETDGIDNDSYELTDTVKKMDYKLIKSVSSSATSIKYKKAKHGKGYLFAIRSYKLVNGQKVESTTMYAAHGVMDYYFCYNAENTKYKYTWPKTEKQARKLCTTIKVKMWDFKNHSKHSGSKKTRIQYITVNKKYAATIKQIYKEIYNNKSKPPIYEAGSYRWRPSESTWSYHSVGTAIDMNANENPMYKYTYTKSGKLKKKIIVGSFYKPKTNPYSIPRNGVIEKTFAKYGFVRLENDLMHFNAEWVYPSCNY